MRTLPIRITMILGVLALAALCLGGCHESYRTVGYGYGTTGYALIGYSHGYAHGKPHHHHHRPHRHHRQCGN
ncbi:MAG: hypothetical protein ACYS0D_14945 [Planctomycetota bacterium]